MYREVFVRQSAVNSRRKPPRVGEGLRNENDLSTQDKSIVLLPNTVKQTEEKDIRHTANPGRPLNLLKGEENSIDAATLYHFTSVCHYTLPLHLIIVP